MKIKELAVLVKGVTEGNDDIDITGLSGVESARSGDLTFAVDEAHLKSAEKSDVSCILTDASLRKSTKPLIRVKNPKLLEFPVDDVLVAVDIIVAFVARCAIRFT